MLIKIETEYWRAFHDYWNISRRKETNEFL